VRTVEEPQVGTAVGGGGAAAADLDTADLDTADLDTAALWMVAV
jgi:hypothetical protein